MKLGIDFIEWYRRTKRGRRMSTQEVKFLIRFTDKNAEVQVYCKDQRSAFIAYYALKNKYPTAELWNGKDKLRS